MKNTNCFSILLAVVLLAAAGCGKDQPHSGRGTASPVKFRAHSNTFFRTKTSYSGDVTSTGTVSVERIDWEKDDRVAIVSPDAMAYDKSTNPWSLKHNVNNQFSRRGYKVSKVDEVNQSSPTISRAGIVAMTSEEDADGDGEGLQWQETGLHRFYGLYPSPSALRLSERDCVSISCDATRAVINAWLPGTQEHEDLDVKAIKEKDLGGGVTRHVIPYQAEYAFMYGGASMKRTESDAQSPPDVNMIFHPMVTTFQFAVRANPGANVKLARLELVSETCALHGGYQAWVTISDQGEDSGHTYPVMPSLGTKSNNNAVVFFLPGNDAGYEITSTKEVLVTLFVLPKGIKHKTDSDNQFTDQPDGSAITDLTVRFYAWIDGEKVGKSLALKPGDDSYGSDIRLSTKGYVEFPAGRKINISGLTLPSQLDPWRFSVGSVDGFTDELSDIVVSSVQIEDFVPVDGGRLDEKTWHLTLRDSELTEWPSNTLFLSGDESISDALKAINVLSYTKNPHTDEETAEPWIVEYSHDGVAWMDDPSINPNLSWLRFKTEGGAAESPGGDGSTSAGDNRALSLTANPKQPAYVTDVHGRIPEMLKSPLSEYETDLSLCNIYGQRYGYSMAIPSITATGPHTANCYVINHTGDFLFPLVYGNAVDATRGTPDGTNAAAYSNPSFTDAYGSAISSPFILGAVADLSNYDAVVLWQDVPEGFDVIQNLSLRAPQAGELPCPYVKFTINSRTAFQPNCYQEGSGILPGNYVIALRDISGGDTPESAKILWSWHIWVTPTPYNVSGRDSDDFAVRVFFFRPNPAQRTQLQNARMLNCLLGWTPALSYQKPSAVERKAYLRFSQPANVSGSGVVITIIQSAVDEGSITFSGYSACQYQWGRKDPFMAEDRICHSPAGYTLFDGSGNLNAASLNTPADRLKNPSVFHSGSATETVAWWNASNVQDDVNRVEKTIYDPSPAGFCLPFARIFTGFTYDGYAAESAALIYGTQTGTGDMYFTSNATSSPDSYDLFMPAGTQRNVNGTLSARTISYWLADCMDNTTYPYYVYMSGNETRPFTATSSDRRQARPVRPMLEQDKY